MNISVLGGTLKIIYQIQCLMRYCTHCASIVSIVAHIVLIVAPKKNQLTNWFKLRWWRPRLTRRFLEEGCPKSSQCFRFHIKAISCSGTIGCANSSPIHAAESWQRSPCESQLDSKLFSGADRWAQEYVCLSSSCHGCGNWNGDWSQIWWARDRDEICE